MDEFEELVQQTEAIDPSVTDEQPSPVGDALTVEAVAAFADTAVEEPALVSISDPVVDDVLGGQTFEMQIAVPAEELAMEDVEASAEALVADFGLQVEALTAEVVDGPDDPLAFTAFEVQSEAPDLDVFEAPPEIEVDDVLDALMVEADESLDAFEDPTL